MMKKISWLVVFIFLFTSLFQGFPQMVSAAENPSSETSFEAESPSNDITGAIGISADDSASGKTIANNINYQTSLTFRNINVNTAGTYAVTIYYVSGQQRNLTISTNGGESSILTCPAVHDNDWSSVGQITTELSLKAGKNDIKFSCDSTSQWGPNLDRIVINTAATQDPPVYPTFTGSLYEAESSDNTFDGATVVDSVNVHGGKYVKVDNSKGLTFNKVQADKDGYYTLTVLYAAGDNNRLIYLTVNGVDVVEIKTPSTGYWDKIGKAQTVIFLNKGDNILAFRNGDAGHPDIWAPYLDAITVTPGAVGPAPVPIVGVPYEAEDAQLGNGAIVQDNPYSSGTKQVGNLGGAKNGSVIFKDVEAVSDGNYTLSLFYVTDSSDASFRIKVNDKSPILISCLKSDMNDKRGARIDVNITLTSGKNSIEIDNAALSSPQLDKIVVNKGNTAYEAEARINTLLDTADNSDDSVASGGTTIGNLGGNGSTNGSVTVNGIYVDKTGKYALKIYYVSGSDRTFDVSINSLPTIKVNCPAVIANDWSTVGSIEVPVTLTKGLNTVNFDNRTDYAPQLDKIEIGNVSETPSPEVHSNIITFSGGKVKIAYNLATGTADYYSNGVKKISDFYAAVKQATGEDMSLSSGLITSKMYTTHTAKTNGNETIIISTKAGYPTMKQHFTLKGGNYFLTQVELVGKTLSSNWMSPMMTDTTGSVDIGSYSDERALFVPYDNDAWTRYNGKPVNGINTSYEVSAFYDNTSRNGLVTGSVTHDTWKTGIYSSGSFNKLDKLYVYGGASSGSNTLTGGTHDVSAHGSITGNDIYSPDIFVGFYSDWRNGMNEFADANAAVVSKLDWAGKVPFGWNSWGKLQSNITYDKAIAVSNFIHDSLQNNNFNDNNVVYVNLDSYWDNMSDAQLKQFVDNCKANGQKAGIYWTPFVDWGNAAATLVAPGSTYTYNDIWLKNSNGDPIYNNGSKAVDPTNPGTKDRIDYFVKRFTDAGFEFIKLDFLTHGSLELKKLDGKMFISEAISPLFPYQYGNARRIACDAFGSINDSEYTLNATTYSWWTNGKLYKFNDPDEMVFEGFTPNENITRVNSAVVSGTMFLNGDDLSETTGQTLAKKYLTNVQVNDVAKKGKAFTAVEDNTGSSASDEFVMKDGSDYYLAVFNYGSSNVTKTIDFSRAGIDPSKKYTVTNLWNNTSTAETSSMNVALSASESKLLKLSVSTSVPTSPTVVDVERLSGSNRIETSIAIAKKQYTYKKPDAVVLATANDFPDALAGSGLAYKYNAPLLIVNKSVSNSKTVLDYITINLSKNKIIYILGGTGAVSKEISDYLTAQGYKIIRLGGKERYETNQKIVNYLNIAKGTPIVIASGNEFADALSISSIADIKGFPILLNDKDSLSANTSNYLTNIKPTIAYIIGETGVLSTNIQTQIKKLNGNIKIVRLGGKDRYETSLKIADYFNLTTNTITVASGLNYPDALCGSVLAARKNSNVLLVDNKNVNSQESFINKQKITHLIIFGGEGVICDGIVTLLMKK